MQLLTRQMRRLDQRILDYWLYPVRIGVAVTVSAILAILFPIVEPTFTRTIPLKYFSRNEQYGAAAVLFALLLLAFAVPYWGGVICTLAICVMRIVAYAHPFSLTPWAVYGGIMLSTLFTVRKQHRLSRWLEVQKEKRDAETAA